jgi:hypothetical protein
MSAPSSCNLDASLTRAQRLTIRTFFRIVRPFGVSELCRKVDVTLTRHGTSHADLASPRSAPESPGACTVTLSHLFYPALRPEWLGDVPTYRGSAAWHCAGGGL